jgi:hypothetical protein
MGDSNSKPQDHTDPVTDDTSKATPIEEKEGAFFDAETETDEALLTTIDEAKQHHLRSKAATESATYGAMGLLAGAIFGMVKVYAASHPAAQTQLGVLNPPPHNFDNEAIGLFVKLADYRIRHGNEQLYVHAQKMVDELIGIQNSIAKYPDDITAGHWLFGTSLSN